MNKNVNDSQNMPDYIKDYHSLVLHFEKQFKYIENNVVKGEKFSDFAANLVFFSEMKNNFNKPIKNKKKSHDLGVDLIAKSLDKRKVLYIQSKYKINDRREFNSVITEFENFYSRYHNVEDTKPKAQQLNLFNANGDEPEQEAIFLVVTTSSLKRVIKSYEDSDYSSQKFYNNLKKEDRIKIFDGEKILNLFKELYQQSFKVPPDIVINFKLDYLKDGNVYLGIVSATEIKSWYEKYNEGLFFENVRKFLDFSTNEKESNVNDEILKTIKEEPQTMLEKNNGINFRADKIDVINEKSIKLIKASIVNGCQTTMCLVEYPNPQACVLVKAVEAKGTKKSWEITKAANLQNKINRIQLELARYIRPQAIEQVAQNLGYAIKDSKASIFELTESINRIQVAPEEIRSLFIALFSRFPKNTIDVDYREVYSDLLEDVWNNDPDGIKTLETLFMIQQSSEKALKRLEKRQRELDEENDEDEKLFRVFQRFSKSAGSSYRAYLSVLTCCSAIKSNIYREEKRTCEDMLEFFKKIRYLILNEENKYILFYKHSFIALIFELMNTQDDIDIILKEMYSKMRKAKFPILFNQVKWSRDVMES